MRVKESAISRRLRLASKDAYESDAELMYEAADMIDSLVNTLKTISVWADNPVDYDQDNKDIQVIAMCAIDRANYLDI